MLKSIHRPHHKLVCAQLRAVREGADLTQVQLAKKLKTTQAWVSAVEVGSTRLDLVQLWEWCRACDHSLEDLVAAVQKAFAALPADKKRARTSAKAPAKSKRKDGTASDS